MAGTTETRTATTQINYGSFDVNRLKGIKPTGFDLSPIWQSVEQRNITRFVQAPAYSLMTQDLNRNFDGSVMPINYKAYVIPKEALDQATYEVLDNSGVSVPKGPLTTLFLSGCIAGAELDDQEWRDLLYKENTDPLRFKSLRVRQFFYLANHYDQAKSAVVNPLYGEPVYRAFVVLIKNMEQNVVRALEAA